MLIKNTYLYFVSLTLALIVFFYAVSASEIESPSTQSVELIKSGYSKIYGVDFSRNMLDLVPKGVYKNIKIADLNKPLTFKDQEFDSVLCVGTFTYGHVRPHALDEFIRITKKNGLICFTVNEGVYKENGFEKKIKELKSKGSWIIKELFISDYIKRKNVNSWTCLAKKIIK